MLVGFRACIATDRLRSQCQQGFIDISPIPFGMIRWFLPVNTNFASNALKGSAATPKTGNDGQRNNALTSMEHKWTSNDRDSARRGKPAGQAVMITDCAGFECFFREWIRGLEAPTPEQDRSVAQSWSHRDLKFTPIPHEGDFM